MISNTFAWRQLLVRQQIGRLFAMGFFLAWAAVAGAGEITVSAASSLSDAFGEIIQNYQRERPATRVWLNTGASGALLRQLHNGAPVDVFASADVDTMTSAVTGGLVARDSVTNFARNTLVLVTNAEAGARLVSLNDLTSSAIVKIAVGNPATVPAGRYAREVLQRDRLWERLEEKLTYTENVRQALAYVARGEVDAGLVYSTDARMMADRVRVAMVVRDSGIDYVMGAVVKPVGGVSAEGTAFIKYVLSPAGQDVLKKHGFLPAE